MNRCATSTLLAALFAACTASALQGCVAVVAAGAAVGAGAIVATDRRSTGAYMDDETLEWKIESQISDRYGDQVHVNAVAFNRLVLLVGEAPDQTIKEDLTRIATDNA